MPNPFAQANNTVGSLSAGHIVLATEWNAAVGGIYTYINSTLLAGGLNKMANKGDLYVFDGANLQALGVGSDGQYLTARSGASYGVDWESIVNTTTLTTKGDILTYSTGLTRLPVGTDGQFLTARSTAPDGIDWETPTGNVPLGGMIFWDLSLRAMPSGYNLCDGGTYNGFVTQNTQGLYFVGAALSANPPASGGMGAVACATIAGDNSAGTGKGPSHNHLEANFIPSSGAGSGSSGYSPIGANTGTTTITPRYIALALIMRTQ